MKTDVSVHVCVFCPPTAGADEKHALTYHNSTNKEVELVVDGKYILTFPAMILHYLNKPDSVLHGWKNPWKPPMWFVHAILGGATISLPPTAEQLRVLPNYRLGYLTTQTGIETCETWMGGTPPALYRLDPKSTTKDVVIDTMGGDENFIHGVPAEFGDLGNDIQNNLITRLKFLIATAVDQNASPNARPHFGIDKNAHDQWILVVGKTDSLGTNALIPPPAKTPDKISFGDYVRSTAYIKYAQSHKLPTAGEYQRLLASDQKPADLENSRKTLFAYTRYHIVGDLIWQIKGDKAEAVLNFQNQEDNYFLKYHEWDLAKWKDMLLEVFKELNIEVEDITKDKVVVKLASLRAIEAQHVTVFPLTISTSAATEPFSPMSVTSPVSFFGQPSPSSSGSQASTSAAASATSPTPAASPVSAQPQTTTTQQTADLQTPSPKSPSTK